LLISTDSKPSPVFSHNKKAFNFILSKSSTARSLKDRFSFSETSNNPSSLAKEFINSLDNPIVVYNRVPKTASTAFTHLLYDLTQGLSSFLLKIKF